MPFVARGRFGHWSAAAPGRLTLSSRWAGRPSSDEMNAIVNPLFTVMVLWSLAAAVEPVKRSYADGRQPVPTQMRPAAA